VALASKLKTKHVYAFSLHPGCKYTFDHETFTQALCFAATVIRAFNDPKAAISTGLQKFMTAEMGNEGIKLIESNTNRESTRPLHSNC